MTETPIPEERPAVPSVEPDTDSGQDLPTPRLGSDEEGEPEQEEAADEH